jgi:hypothetical protein
MGQLRSGDMGYSPNSETHIQLKVRVRREEHAWLVEEARKRGSTLNAMLAWRVMQNRDNDDLMTISRLLQEASRLLTPLLTEGFERAHYADCLRSAGAAFDLIRPLLPAIQDKAVIAIRKHADDFDRSRRILEQTVGEKVIDRGTTGS